MLTKGLKNSLQLKGKTLCTKEKTEKPVTQIKNSLTEGISAHNYSPLKLKTLTKRGDSQ